MLPENRDMLAVFRDGFGAETRNRLNVVEVEFPTSGWRNIHSTSPAPAAGDLATEAAISSLGRAEVPTPGKQGDNCHHRDHDAADAEHQEGRERLHPIREPSEVLPEEANDEGER